MKLAQWYKPLWQYYNSAKFRFRSAIHAKFLLGIYRDFSDSCTSTILMTLPIREEVLMVKSGKSTD
jgi:hypothetical protein